MRRLSAVLTLCLTISLLPVWAQQDVLAAATDFWINTRSVLGARANVPTEAGTGAVWFAGSTRLGDQSPLERAAKQSVNDLRQMAIGRFAPGNGLAARSLGIQPFVRPLQITPDNWLSGSGFWSSINDPANWSTGAEPAVSNDVGITTGATVQLNVSATINNLTIGSSSSLNINDTRSLTIDGTSITNSNSTGSGGLILGSGGNGTNLILGSGNVALNGGGTVTLSNQANNYIYGASAAYVLTNVNNTIQGSGNIGNGSMGLVNQGIIDANQTQALTIWTSNGTSNSGTLEATAGGNLILQSDTFTNTGNGTILASGSGSVVTLLGSTIVGGTLNTANGGLIQAANSRCCAPALNGVTNLGTYQIPDANGTTLVGTITNSGNIQLNSAGDGTQLYVDGAVTLTGGGKVTLSDNGQNTIAATAGGDSLTNVNNTISGSGYIGYGAMEFTNQAAGVVDAVSATGNSLVIATSAGVTNLGMMEAGSGGALVFSGTYIDEMDATTVVNTNGTTNGTIEALNGGTVVLGNVNILGGTITTAGNGVILAEGAQLIGTSNTVTNAGNMQIPNGYYLNIQGTIDNTGTLALNSDGNFTSLYVNSPTATLQGSGTVALSDNPNNRIWAENSGSQLTIGPTQTIQGPGGNIGVGNLNLVNQGTIDATASVYGNSLTIQPLSTFTNTGLLEAAGGGSLALYGGTFLNAGGIITSGTGSNVVLEGYTTVTGGTLNGPGSFTSVNGTLIGVTNSANVQIPDSDQLYIAGTINNSGTLALNSTGNNTEIYVSSATATLQGSGTVTLSDSDNNYISEPNASGDQLTIAQPIKGPGGNIGGGSLALVNQSTIDATASAFGNALTIQPLSTFTNSGLLEATGGGSLALDGGTYANTGATITAGAGSTVTLENGATIAGGTLNGAGTFTALGGATLNGLTNAGTLQVANGSYANLTGTINNTGGLQINSLGNSTYLDASGSVTLTGGGTLTLSDNNNNYVGGAGSTLTNVNNTISGSGNIGNGNLGFTNQAAGIVDATSARGNSLTVNSGALAVTNAGLFEASGGGTLIVESSVLNSGGTIEALAGTGTNAGGTVAVSGTTVTGGTVSALGTGVNAGAVLLENGGALSDVTTNGTLPVPNNNSGTLAGTITNNGSVRVNSTGYATYLYINGNTTLDGNGTIALSNNANNYMRGSAGTELLTNNGNTIEGSGTIGDLGILNNAAGTILANQATELFIQPNSNGFTNNGTVQVNAGSTLDITGGPFNNFNSGTGTLTGGTYNVSGTLQFDNADIVTNAANITLTGAGAQILSNTDANALASFTTNAAAGVFKLASGASLTTAGGSFTNDGSFTVSKGTTFAVGGSSFNFTQAAGSATVDGTVTSTSLGTVAVDGGSLDGEGTLGDNVDVAGTGTLSPGDSKTKTGALTVADTYTQGSSGTLDIQIDGATAGTKYDQLKVTQSATLGGTLDIKRAAGFTPTLGETFTILTASSVSGAFGTVDGLAINGSEHFTVTYNAGSVVLTVVSGALQTAAASDVVSTRLLHPPLTHGFAGKGHYGLAVFAPGMAQVPAAGMARMAPVSQPVSLGHPAAGLKGFRPMDDFSSPLPLYGAGAGAGDVAVAGSLGISPVSAAAYNSMNAMNHMRFECGVDLKALLKTSRKQLFKGLWAGPDSPDTLALGYITYNSAH
jgi:hypothetical protein